jgi:hypothetical protein
MYSENSNKITEANTCYQEATIKSSLHFDKQIWRYQNNKKISANKAYNQGTLYLEQMTSNKAKTLTRV